MSKDLQKPQHQCKSNEKNKIITTLRQKPQRIRKIATVEVQLLAILLKDGYPNRPVSATNRKAKFIRIVVIFDNEDRKYIKNIKHSTSMKDVKFIIHVLVIVFVNCEFL